MTSLHPWILMMIIFLEMALVLGFHVTVVLLLKLSDLSYFLTSLDIFIFLGPFLFPISSLSFAKLPNFKASLSFVSDFQTQARRKKLYTQVFILNAWLTSSICPGTTAASTCTIFNKLLFPKHGPLFYFTIIFPVTQA